MRWRVISLEAGEGVTHCPNHIWALDSTNNPNRQAGMQNGLSWGWERGSLCSPVGLELPLFHPPIPISAHWNCRKHCHAHSTSPLMFRKPELFRSQLSQKENLGLTVQRKICKLKLYVWHIDLWPVVFHEAEKRGWGGEPCPNWLGFRPSSGSDWSHFAPSCQLSFAWHLSCRELISQLQLFQNAFYGNHKLLDDSLKA